MSKDDEDDISVANEVQENETALMPGLEDSDRTGDEFSPFDEIAEEYKPSPIRKVTGADGLPTNFHEGSSDIPALSVESLVCMEDTSVFVTRDEHGRISSTFQKEKVQRMPNGKYYVKGVEVQPVRPRCEYYVRQMAMFDYNPEGKVHLRLCSARRTTEGTFMTVRDSAMWACSMRNPRDLVTEEKHLDKFDAEKIEQGKNRKHFSIFKKE